MNIPPFLLLTTLLLCGCAGVDTDAPALKKVDAQDALERGVVLPGMTPRQVRFVWGEPRECRTTATGEQWIYNPDVPAAGVGYHPLVTVGFVRGRVDSVMNGDLKRKRAQMRPYNNLTHRARSYNGANAAPGLLGY